MVPMFYRLHDLLYTSILYEFLIVIKYYSLTIGNRSEDSIRWNSTSVDNNKRTTSRLLLSRSNAQIAGSVIVSCNASNVHGYQVRNAYAAWVSSLSGNKL
jgi:hypothetical protein